MSRGYSTVRWASARGQALRRARYRCERCKSARQLRVHHIDRRGATGPRSCDLSNLIVLCESCHRIEHAPSLLDVNRTQVVIPMYRRE